jgi:drug/metabolite transporter (DMT)-like permease
MKKYLAYILILISVFVYGTYTGIQKQGLQIINNPIAFAFYTMIYCSLFLMPFALYSFFKLKNKKDILNKSTVFSLFSISFLSQFLAISLKLYALNMTSATSVAFIASFSSVTLSIYSVLLLKEKLPKKFFAVLLFMCFGLALFRYKGQGFEFGFGLGELLALVFISLTSLSNSLAKLTMNKHTPPFITSFGRMIFAVPLLGFVVLLNGSFKINHLFSVWPVLAGIIFATRVITLYSGVNLTKLSNVAVFNIFAPIVTFAYAFLMLGEKLNYIQLVGGTIIIIGAYLMILIKKKENSFFDKLLFFVKNDKKTNQIIDASQW